MTLKLELDVSFASTDIFKSDRYAKLQLNYKQPKLWHGIKKRHVLLCHVCHRSAPFILN